MDPGFPPVFIVANPEIEPSRHLCETQGVEPETAKLAVLVYLDRRSRS